MSRSTLQQNTPKQRMPQHANKAFTTVAEHPNSDSCLESPTLSIVVPTRNESDNVGPLVHRIQQLFEENEVEVIFVDDSDDDTASQVESLAETESLPIRLIHREGEARTGGLGGAVLEGLGASRADLVCVMDADLQHPPEIVPLLLEEITNSDADIVIGSRHSDGGAADEGFNIMRAGISSGSTMLAHLLFPSSLSDVTDPMSGFFLVKKTSINLSELRPSGFKILLEILVRTPNLRVAEVGFNFGQRLSGESKASVAEGVRYLMLVSQLRFGQDAARLVRFASVGISGMAVNLLLVALFTEIFSIYYLWSAVLATQGSTTWNYVLTNRWVYRDRKSPRRPITKIGLFYGMNNAGLLLRGPLIILFTSMFAINYLISVALSLVILMLFRFAFSNSLIWTGENTMQKQRDKYRYNIHDLVSVVSETRLPELEPFKTSAIEGVPDLRIQIGGTLANGSTPNGSGSNHTHFAYHDGIGKLGFQVEAVVAETIDIRASRLLGHSPHVLYTNVVEPILRWTFVEKGYALVHGATISVDQDAYIVTARTDTGKTTTVLRILDRQRHDMSHLRFLSDDLTLLGPDGTVLSFPKPMTISSHTVAAVRTPLLTRRERITLPIQSRIHSRDGRRLALLLARTRLPMATINTITQLLVPPPKYDVERLVPTAKKVPSGKLAGMFVIERGGDESSLLNSDETLEILMSNSEDAFGFPPYGEIRAFLFNLRGNDLRTTERNIVSSGLNGLRGRRMSSSTLGWAEEILPIIVKPEMATRPNEVGFGAIPTLAIPAAED